MKKVVTKSRLPFSERAREMRRAIRYWSRVVSLRKRTNQAEQSLNSYAVQTSRPLRYYLFIYYDSSPCPLLIQMIPCSYKRIRRIVYQSSHSDLVLAGSISVSESDLTLIFFKLTSKSSQSHKRLIPSRSHNFASPPSSHIQAEPHSITTSFRSFF